MPITVAMREWAEMRGSPSPEVLRQIQTACTVRNPQYDQILRFSPTGGRYTQVPENFYIFQNLVDGIRFPRGLDVSKHVNQYLPIKASALQKMVKPPKLLVKPTESQKSFLEALDDPGYRKETGTYLFVAPPGTGKTIGAVMAALRFGLKTLILVDRELILTTWLRDLEKALGIRNVGVIQANKWSIGPQFTIAMTQTLRRRESRWKDLWEQIGTLVVDECDLVPAPIFFDVVSKCPAKYRIGITATEKRKDKLHNVMYLLFGKPIMRATEQVTETTVPVSEIFETRTQFRPPRTLHEVLSGGPEESHQLLSAISQDLPRNQLICDRVSARLREGRTVLVSVVRRDHAKILHDLYLKMNPAAQKLNPVILLGQSDNEPGEQKILDGSCRLVFATTQLLKRGVNFPRIDSLVVAGPLASDTNLIQLVGRIRRICPENPKKIDAVIDDFIDNDSTMLFRWFRVHRVPVYRSLGVKKYQTVFYA